MDKPEYQDVQRMDLDCVRSDIVAFSCEKLPYQHVPFSIWLDLQSGLIFACSDVKPSEESSGPGASFTQAAISQAVEIQAVPQLPLQNRDVINLVDLCGNVTTDGKIYASCNGIGPADENFEGFSRLVANAGQIEGLIIRVSAAPARKSRDSMVAEEAYLRQGRRNRTNGMPVYDF